MSPKKPKKPSTRKTRPRPRENVFQDGPYVVSALLCESVLQEQDGVKTAVRIVDRRMVTIQGTQIPDPLPPVPVDWTLLVKLKNGKIQGRHEIKVSLVNPLGKTESSFSQEADFEGGENRGVDIVAKLNLQLKHEGIYWFEIYFDSLLLTKTPLQAVAIVRRQGETQSQIQ